MLSIPVVRHLKATLLVLIVTVAATGCSKKEEEPSAAAPMAATTPSAAPVANVPVPTDVTQSFAEVDAALKANDYEKAARTLLAVREQKQLTDQQAQEARNRMVGLQRSLASAIASGDPNAKAAGELLRRSTMHRPAKVR